MATQTKRSKSKCDGRFIALASLAVAACLPMAAFAEDAAATSPSSSTCDMKPTLGLGLGYTSRAQYDRDPYERTYVKVNAGLCHAVHSLGLSQSVAYRHGSANYYGDKNGPSEEIYNSDLILSYGYNENLIPALEAYKMSLAPSAEATLGTSRQSTTEDHLKGTLGLGLDLSWSAHEYLTIAPGVGATYNFYDWTMNEDGEANTEYDVNAGLTVIAKYKKVSFTQSVRFYKEYLYRGYRPNYTFSNSSALSYKLTETMSLRGSLTTSDNQLRYGRNRNFKMYDKDITRFTIEVMSAIY